MKASLSPLNNLSNKSIEPSPFPLLGKMAVITLAFAMSACGQAPNQSAAIETQGTGIIGGTDSNGNEPFAKHIVGVYDVAVGAICTGTILSESIIITAAHCVESPAASLRVVFGTDFNSPQIAVRAVDAYKVSPLWAFRQGEELNTGDISVVKFSGGLPAGYKPIKFLTDASLLKDGAPVMLAGFGASDVVQVRDPRTGRMVSDHQNAGKLRFVTTSIKKAEYTKSEVLVEQAHGKGACHGDSGGPAYTELNGELVVFGVTSRGVDDPNDTCGVSAAYTNVAYYANWVVRTAKDLNKIAPAPVRPAIANPANPAPAAVASR
ncbi:MAG: trypsin-like serine protease [Bdellovibrionales bacterium]|nr:trypsin-like serine protease [Bdellovibrionales bacterium]